MATLVAEPGFHSSAFALVPKKDVPLRLNGRTIHDLSSPASLSVNDLTDSSASPDATWDPFVSIAQRVRDLRRRYPGYAIYALGADIADAFHHVPVHEMDASAFGGNLPRTDIGIVSGMAVFGWTASPGYFAVLGKAVRHYQRTGSSYVLGCKEEFWIFQWVDDIVFIEVDVGDRLQRAEKRLRDGVKLVFGSEGWHEGKFTTWSQNFHAVGIDWSIPEETVSVPQRKIDKVKTTIAEALTKQFVSKKRLDSIVGVLRHVISFIPVTKPFIQRLTATQLACGRSRAPGVPMTPFLRKDLEWWEDLVFQNEFAGMPMKLFDPNSSWNECWFLEEHTESIRITSTSLAERCLVSTAGESRQAVASRALAKVTEAWGPKLSQRNSWISVFVYCNDAWAFDLVRKMSTSEEGGQHHLRKCALSQDRFRMHFKALKRPGNMGQTRTYDRRQRVADKTGELKRASVAESTLGKYAKNFRLWEAFCNEFGFPVWIDQLPRAQQARMVGLYAGLCALEGHNRGRRGNKYQTFDGKMAAVVFAHKALRNGQLDYKDPEFELVAQGYKRSNSQVDRKQPVTTQMLLEIQRRLSSSDADRMLWNSIVLGFFFLDRSSELWGPVVSDTSTGKERIHCVKAKNVIIRNKRGDTTSHDDPNGFSVEIVFESHKGDRVGQGSTVRHYRSNHPHLCPVAAARECLSIRDSWLRAGRSLGPYLTSTSATTTIKKRTVASAIKEAAHQMGLRKQDYSAHSLRIGGACALLAAGKSDLVIRLMGRWSSWCFSVYTRLRPGMIPDAASSMINASSWESREVISTTRRGDTNEAISES